jgi:hypothetical protein
MSTPLKYAVIFLASGALVVGAWFGLNLAKKPDHTDKPSETPRSPGRLVVLVVFDQMRGDYPARWAEAFSPGGFERMKKSGVWFTDVHLPYAATSTGPGHATLITGTTPSVHGIVENDWYDRAASARVYCAEPLRPYDLVPPAPKGAASRGSEIGFAPDRLLAPTVGDKLQAANPKSRVISLSIKDRTAVLLGGKQPTAAYCFDTRDGLFHTGAYYRAEAHPWVAEFNAAGRSNEWMGKEWTRFKPDANYEKLAGRDDAAGEAFGTVDIPRFAQRQTFPHPFPNAEQKAAKPGLYYSCVEMSPAGNELLGELAKKAIAAENLGNGDAADLLLLSFSSNDLVGHSWGPDSQEVLDLTLRSDATLAGLMTYLDEKLGDRWSLVVTSDHGVAPIPEQNRFEGAVRKTVSDLLPPLAAALDDAFGLSPAGPTKWFALEAKDAQDLWPWVYLNHAAIRERKLDPAAVADYAAQWIGNRPFMLTAFTRKQIESGTLPPAGPGREKELQSLLGRIKASYHPDRCGDLVGVVKPGVLVTKYPMGTAHGSPHNYDTHIPVLAVGNGIPETGRRVEPQSALIVAPLLARLLGIDPPAAANEKLPLEIQLK